ncbi:MAG: HD domain-containing protein [Acidobacteriota bacterium]
MPFVRTNEPIATWQDGDFAQGYALVTRRDVRQDRRGRDYMDVELSDASGSVTGKIWPDSPAMGGRFAERDFVAFKGTVKSYRDQLQLNLDHCRMAGEADRENGFDPAALVPTTPEDLEALWRRLKEIYPGEIRRPELQLLAEQILEKHGEGLKEHPAAKSIHHAYRGGLLEHVVSMAELGILVCGRYSEVDRDLVLLGVLLHDLGKLRELGALPRNDYSIEGQLVGHIVIGQNMLRACCADLDGAVPRRLEMHLEHLILSHHGRREYGSPMEPATAEAFVLHAIDNLDSKLAQLRRAREVEGEGMRYLRSIGRSLFFDPELGSGSEG